MKQWSMFAVFCLPCITLCGGAIYLAANEIDGWGWLLFVAVFLTPSNWEKSQ